MEQSTAIQLPELVSHIFSYLSPSDLISCTGVSFLWEEEARKYLLNLAPTSDLCCSNVEEYLDTMAPRSHIHSHLKLVKCSQPDCLATLVTKLQETNSLGKVSSLVTGWTVDETWSQPFSSWALFQNLESLDLTLSTDDRSPTLKLLVEGDNHLAHRPEEFVFPSVKTLVFRIPRNRNVWLEILLAVIGPTLLKTMPEVTTVKLFYVGNYAMEKLIQNGIIPKETRHFIVIDSNITPDLLLDVPIPLSRLEFNPLHHTVPRWRRILHTFRDTLEHVIISKMEISSPNPRDRKTLTVPVLPKLKVFEALFTPGAESCENNIAELKLCFESVTEENPILDYSVQFPSLRRLDVGMERGHEASEAFWVETCLPFLNQTFLQPGQEPCDTVKLLNISAPGSRKINKFKVLTCEDCDFIEISKMEGRYLHRSWKIEAEFFAKVCRVFPNLRNLRKYQDLATEKKDDVEREEDIKNWLQVGEKLGLVKKQERLQCPSE